jgi:hypothetical protein
LTLLYINAWVPTRRMRGREMVMDADEERNYKLNALKEIKPSLYQYTI